MPLDPSSLVPRSATLVWNRIYEPGASARSVRYLSSTIRLRMPRPKMPPTLDLAVCDPATTPTRTPLFDLEAPSSPGPRIQTDSIFVIGTHFDSYRLRPPARDVLARETRLVRPPANH